MVPVKLMIALLLFVTTGTQAQSWTKARATEWFNKGEWQGGLKIMPDASIDQQQFAVEYHKHPAWWDAAFAYLRQTDFEKLSPGNYPIVGTDVYVKITENASRNIDSTRWEVHHDYHDLHYIISGKEMVGITSATGLSPLTTYDSKNDIIFYKGDGPYFLESQDRFFIMFANQAHRPFLKIGGYEKAKRAVIKIRYTK